MAHCLANTIRTDMIKYTLSEHHLPAETCGRKKTQGVKDMH